MNKPILSISVLCMLLFIVMFNISCLSNYAFTPEIPEPAATVQSECVTCHTSQAMLEAVANPLAEEEGDCSGTEG